ncbi:MAG: iron-containing alcohol dehydrogenase [Lentisphaeria bacterium]|nr:iron-containing alcohol dehydrogenase [Lentisphaeria bacterium]
MANTVANVFTMETVPLKFGWNLSQEVGYDAAYLSMKHVMLLADPNVLELAAVVTKSLTEQDITYTLFTDIASEPTDKSWQLAIDCAQAEKFDGFIAIGGGSTLDTAKAASLYSEYPDDFLAYINKPIGQAKPIPGPLKPLIAIPTTAGTGSETTSIAVVDILDLNVKTGISHRLLRPTLAVIDPANTLDCPGNVSAFCGLDVFSHALESYTSCHYTTKAAPERPELRPPYSGANPISDVWCEAALLKVHQYLVRAYQSPGDREAREELILASSFAGMGFGNAGVHIPHAMSYPIAGHMKEIGSSLKVPHGQAVIFGAAATMEFISDVLTEKHLKVLEILGMDTAKVKAEDAAKHIADYIRNLIRSLELPNGLSAIGYKDEHIPALTQGTFMQERLMVQSPKEVTQSDIEEIYTKSMSLW